MRISDWSSDVCSSDLGKILSHLTRDILFDQFGTQMDGIGDALRVGAAVALEHDAVEAEEHRAVVIVRIEMVAQQFGRRARDQETDLRARRRGEGAAQQVGDEARDRTSVVSGKSVSVSVNIGD